jgi:aminoglycoside 6'-N-acetyltransferase
MVEEPGLRLRSLREADFEVLHAWLNASHVVAWWPPPPTFGAVIAKYTPRVVGSEPVHCLVASVRERPIGMIQWYRVGDVDYSYPAVRLSPQAIALDMFIGDAEFVGRGIGSTILDRLTGELPSARAPYFVIDPEATNLRAIRAYARAGFRPLAKVAGSSSIQLLMWKLEAVS